MRNKQTGTLADNTPLYERKIDVYSKAGKDHAYVYLYTTRAARTCREALQRFEDRDRTFYANNAGMVQVSKDCLLKACFQK